MFLYHGSNKKLNKLRPSISTHRKSYVYAVENKTLAMLFMARWNDFLLTLNTITNNDSIIINLVERYPNAFKDIFQGKSGFLYTVSSKDFNKGKTSWKLEWVSEKEVDIIDSLEINDLYGALLKSEINLYKYPNRPSSIPLDDSDMIHRAVKLYELSGDIHNVIYCMKRFPHLKEDLKLKFKEIYGIKLDIEKTDTTNA